MDDTHTLLGISPLDGRYADKVTSLNQYFSEAALMRYRILIEIEWFIFLFNELKLAGTKRLKAAEIKDLRSIYEDFDIVAARRVKEIEAMTNHDVKAVEYYIKENLKTKSLEKYGEFVHFACTSEDINNLAYACIMRDFAEREYFPLTYGLVQELYLMAVKYRKVPMLSHTHGQPATPTTLGKEVLNFVARLERQVKHLEGASFIMGKINGAVGNYNAHIVAYPGVDWIDASKKFVQSLGIGVNLYTTQIEPHDFMADCFDGVKRINTILIGMSRDFWTYVSLGYFKQKVKAGEVGSSTMPHKVNPIDFENAEGNLGVANALLSHLSEKLPISRMQRDLSDSTAERNIGSALCYSYLAYKSFMKGLSKLEVNHQALKDDLKDKWELLAEPIQVVMRKHGIEGAYEKLKELTRGKAITKAGVQKLIRSLKIPAADKSRLLKLTPETYVGLAEKLVDDYQLDILGNMGCGGGSCGGCSGGGCSGCGV
ncbi:MAG: adenylosuccinate lyase [Candidatus Gracilibacteria bacterium]